MEIEKFDGCMAGLQQPAGGHMADNPPVDAAFLAELGAEAEQMPVASDEGGFARLRSLAEQVETLDTRIAKGEALLKSLKAERYKIISKDMVDAMGGITEAFEHGGKRYELTEYCKANIPEEYRDAGHNYLESAGAGALITRQVMVDFPVGFEEEANALVTYVRERYQMAEVALKRGVPWARLTSWVKEYRARQREARSQHAIDEATPVPPDLPEEILGISAGPLVKVSASKKAKNGG